MSYSGAATADTNYPIDEELLKAMGPRVRRECLPAPGPCVLHRKRVLTASNVARGHRLPPQVESRSVSEHKSLVYSAIQVVVLEQSIPHAALAKASGSGPDWEAWEGRVLKTYLLSHPGDKAAPELAGEIAWLLGQVAPAAVLPAWRGQPLKDFLAACKRCTETGSRFTHYHADPATCPTCILNSKGVRPPGHLGRWGRRSCPSCLLLPGVTFFQGARRAFS